MAKKKRHIIASILIALAGIAFLVPIIWVFSLSLRSKKDVFSAMFFTRELHFENYFIAWKTFGFSRLFVNSVFITVLSVAVILVIASLASYAFTKLKYRGSGAVFYTILLGMMIPPSAVIIPLFIIMRVMGLYNTHMALILSYIAFSIPIAILVFYGFFASVPKELIESARIDGSKEIFTFVRIVLPLSTPAIATVTIFSFMQNWNEFLMALVLLKDKVLYTLPVGMANFVGQWDSPWQLVAAGVIISSIPVFLLYLFIQDLFVKGLTAGAVKG